MLYNWYNEPWARCVALIVRNTFCQIRVHCMDIKCALTQHNTLMMMMMMMVGISPFLHQLPNKIYLRHTFSVSVCRYICSEEWPSQVHNYYYTLALLALQFVIPLAVLIFTYTRIAIAVWGKRPPGEAENSRDQRMARSKRKVSTIGAYYLLIKACVYIRLL